jgi:hypothetical protein
VLNPSPQRGTVVRIIQDNPQLVAVSWDSDTTTRVIIPEMSRRRRLIPQEHRRYREHEDRQ